MTKVPIDIILLIRPVSSYRFEPVAERLSKDSIPRFFGLLQPGSTLWYSEVLLAAVTTPGVRRGRIVRLSRASDQGGVPPEKLEFSPEEQPVLGTVEIDIDPEPSQAPFA
jgi:hypothetical protein